MFVYVFNSVLNIFTVKKIHHLKNLQKIDFITYEKPIPAFT